MHFCVLLSSLYSLLSWRVNTRARSLSVCVSSVGAFARISKRYYSSFSLPSVYDIVVERPPLLKLFNAAASPSCTARLLSVFPLSSTLWIFSLLLLTARELPFLLLTLMRMKLPISVINLRLPLHSLSPFSSLHTHSVSRLFSFIFEFLLFSPSRFDLDLLLFCAVSLVFNKRQASLDFLVIAAPP